MDAKQRGPVLDALRKQTGFVLGAEMGALVSYICQPVTHQVSSILAAYMGMHEYRVRKVTIYPTETLATLGPHSETDCLRWPRRA